MTTFEIPIDEDVTVYTYICVASEYDWHIGRIYNYLFERADATDIEKYVLLGSQEVTIDLDQNIDLVKEALGGLEEIKKVTLARHFKELKKVQDSIDNLLAIEYVPT